MTRGPQAPAPHPTRLVASRPAHVAIEEYLPAAVACVKFLRGLFPGAVPDDIQIRREVVRLYTWVAELFSRTQIRFYVISGALDLIMRLEVCDFPALPPHELLTVACMLAHKYLEDTTYRIEAWSTAGQDMVPKDRVVQLEKAMLECLEWDVNFDFRSLREIGRRVFGNLCVGNECFF
ncbi:hypothetical protein BXZ70DRAFT_73306 [Cristinia sonorae]|uniref:Cyclin N-terminal domain-containing protein n=1 Tax=Cristinia sonorae TaxID=1940300 RepID=A0A8K0USN0_9AGAR|nr:hypothetical protein BXZ70DRAFT_73306 [Cristinia sonorae]